MTGLEARSSIAPDLTLSSHGEEGEDDAKSAWPSDTLGYTHVTMVITTGRDGAKA